MFLSLSLNSQKMISINLNDTINSQRNEQFTPVLSLIVDLKTPNLTTINTPGIYHGPFIIRKFIIYSNNNTVTTKH